MRFTPWKKVPQRNNRVSIKKPRLVCGIGINDAEYAVTTHQLETVDGKNKWSIVWVCPHYREWVNMLKRCSEKLQQRYPTYLGVECCEDWKLFSNFKKWRQQKESNTPGGIEHYQLDKDIIVVGNKLYSPETCAYVNAKTNSFVTARDADRGIYPIGVCLHKKTNKFVAQCNNPFKVGGRTHLEYLGLYDTPEEAHEVWRARKHELAQLVAATESDPRVVEALKKRYSVEEWYGLSLGVDCESI